jgi:hypothetical protein
MKHWLLLIYSGIVSCVFAQKAVVKLEVDPKITQSGEAITVTVKSNIQGEIDIDLPSAFINGYSVMNGMEQETDYNTGRVITYFYYSQEGIIKKDGNYTFGPAYIKSGSKTYKSNTVSVTIRKEPIVNSTGEITSRQMRQAAFGIIERNKSKLYEGEPLILNAKIYSRFYPTHFEDYQTYMPEGALEKQSLSSNNKLVAERVKIKGIDMYSIDYDRSLVFPNKPGKLQVDPYKLILKRGFEGMPVISTGSVIEILSLPKSQPKSFIGMVGKLKMTQSLSNTDVKKGDIVKLNVILEGTGNIHNVNNPKINLPKGITLYGDPKVKEDYSFTAVGAEGKIEYEYTLQINQEGSFELPPLMVSYFDPKIEKYVTLKEELGTLNGKEIKQVAKNQGKTKLISENLSESSHKVSTGNTWLKSPVTWVSLFSILAFVAVVGFIKKPKVKPEVAAVQSQKIEKTVTLATWTEVEMDLQSAQQLRGSDTKLATQNIENAIHKSACIALKIDPKSLTKDEVVEKMRQQYCNAISCDKLKSMIETCQNARYGFGLTAEEEQELFASAEAIVGEMKRL